MRWAPVVLVAGVVLAYAAGVVDLRRSTGRAVPPASRVAAFVLGAVALAASLSPPVEVLAERNLAVHMLQHVVIWLGAAPLLVTGRPLAPLSRVLIPRGRRPARLVPRWAWRLREGAGTGGGLVVAWLAATATLWLWHVPPAYEVAVRSPALHALEHLSLLATAALFWWSLTAARRGAGEGAALVSLVLSAGQSAALGALLTFSTVPWYATYPSIDDQRVAGLIMWVPGGVVYLVAAGVLFLRWLSHEEPAGQRTVSP